MASVKRTLREYEIKISAEISDALKSVNELTEAFEKSGQKAFSANIKNEVNSISQAIKTLEQNTKTQINSINENINKISTQDVINKMNELNSSINSSLGNLKEKSGNVAKAISSSDVAGFEKFTDSIISSFNRLNDTLLDTKKVLETLIGKDWNKINSAFDKLSINGAVNNVEKDSEKLKKALGNLEKFLGRYENDISLWSKVKTPDSKKKDGMFGDLISQTYAELETYRGLLEEVQKISKRMGSEFDFKSIFSQFEFRESKSKDSVKTTITRNTINSALEAVDNALQQKRWGKMNDSTILVSPTVEAEVVTDKELVNKALDKIQKEIIDPINEKVGKIKIPIISDLDVADSKKSEDKVNKATVKEITKKVNLDVTITQKAVENAIDNAVKIAKEYVENHQDALTIELPISTKGIAKSVEIGKSDLQAMANNGEINATVASSVDINLNDTNIILTNIYDLLADWKGSGYAISSGATPTERRDNREEKTSVKKTSETIQKEVNNPSSSTPPANTSTPKVPRGISYDTSGTIHLKGRSGTKTGLGMAKATEELSEQRNYIEAMLSAYQQANKLARKQESLDSTDLFTKVTEFGEEEFNIFSNLEESSLAFRERINESVDSHFEEVSRLKSIVDPIRARAGVSDKKLGKTVIKDAAKKILGADEYLKFEENFDKLWNLEKGGPFGETIKALQNSLKNTQSALLLNGNEWVKIEEFTDKKKASELKSEIRALNKKKSDTGNNAKKREYNAQIKDLETQLNEIRDVDYVKGETHYRLMSPKTTIQNQSDYMNSLTARTNKHYLTDSNGNYYGDLLADARAYVRVLLEEKDLMERIVELSKDPESNKEALAIKSSELQSVRKAVVGETVEARRANEEELAKLDLQRLTLQSQAKGNHTENDTKLIESKIKAIDEAREKLLTRNYDAIAYSIEMIDSGAMDKFISDAKQKEKYYTNEYKKAANQIEKFSFWGQRYVPGEGVQEGVQTIEIKAKKINEDVKKAAEEEIGTLNSRLSVLERLFVENTKGKMTVNKKGQVSTPDRLFTGTGIELQEYYEKLNRKKALGEVIKLYNEQQKFLNPDSKENESQDVMGNEASKRALISTLPLSEKEQGNYAYSIGRFGSLAEKQDYISSLSDKSLNEVLGYAKTAANALAKKVELTDDEVFKEYGELLKDSFGRRSSSDGSKVSEEALAIAKENAKKYAEAHPQVKIIDEMLQNAVTDAETRIAEIDEMLNTGMKTLEDGTTLELKDKEKRDLRYQKRQWQATKISLTTPYDVADTYGTIEDKTKELNALSKKLDSVSSGGDSYVKYAEASRNLNLYISQQEKKIDEKRKEREQALKEFKAANELYSSPLPTFTDAKEADDEIARRKRIWDSKNKNLYNIDHEIASLSSYKQTEQYDRLFSAFMDASEEVQKNKNVRVFDPDIPKYVEAFNKANKTNKAKDHEKLNKIADSLTSKGINVKDIDVDNVMTEAEFNNLSNQERALKNRLQFLNNMFVSNATGSFEGQFDSRIDALTSWAQSNYGIKNTSVKTLNNDVEMLEKEVALREQNLEQSKLQKEIDKSWVVKKVGNAYDIKNTVIEQKQVETQNEYNAALEEYNSALLEYQNINAAKNKVGEAEISYRAAQRELETLNASNKASSEAIVLAKKRYDEALRAEKKASNNEMHARGAAKLANLEKKNVNTKQTLAAKAKRELDAAKKETLEAQKQYEFHKEIVDSYNDRLKITNENISAAKKLYESEVQNYNKLINKNYREDRLGLAKKRLVKATNDAKKYSKESYYRQAQDYLMNYDKDLAKRRNDEIIKLNDSANKKAIEDAKTIKSNAEAEKNRLTKLISDINKDNPLEVLSLYGKLLKLLNSQPVLNEKIANNEIIKSGKYKNGWTSSDYNSLYARDILLMSQNKDNEEAYKKFVATKEAYSIEKDYNTLPSRINYYKTNIKNALPLHFSEEFIKYINSDEFIVLRDALQKNNAEKEAIRNELSPKIDEAKLIRSSLAYFRENYKEGQTGEEFFKSVETYREAKKLEYDNLVGEYGAKRKENRINVSNGLEDKTNDIENYYLPLLDVMDRDIKDIDSLFKKRDENNKKFKELYEEKERIQANRNNIKITTETDENLEAYSKQGDQAARKQIADRKLAQRLDQRISDVDSEMQNYSPYEFANKILNDLKSGNEKYEELMSEITQKTSILSDTSIIDQISKAFSKFGYKIPSDISGENGLLEALSNNQKILSSYVGKKNQLAFDSNTFKNDEVKSKEISNETEIVNQKIEEYTQNINRIKKNIIDSIFSDIVLGNNITYADNSELQNIISGYFNELSIDYNNQLKEAQRQIDESNAKINSKNESNNKQQTSNNISITEKIESIKKTLSNRDKEIADYNNKLSEELANLENLIAQKDELYKILTSSSEQDSNIISDTLKKYKNVTHLVTESENEVSSIKRYIELISSDEYVDRKNAELTSLERQQFEINNPKEARKRTEEKLKEEAEKKIKKDSIWAQISREQGYKEKVEGNKPRALSAWEQMSEELKLGYKYANMQQDEADAAKEISDIIATIKALEKAGKDTSATKRLLEEKGAEYTEKFEDMGFSPKSGLFLKEGKGKVTHADWLTTPEKYAINSYAKMALDAKNTIATENKLTPPTVQESVAGAINSSGLATESTLQAVKAALTGKPIDKIVSEGKPINPTVAATEAKAPSDLLKDEAKRIQEMAKGAEKDEAIKKFFANPDARDSYYVKNKRGGNLQLISKSNKDYDDKGETLLQAKLKEWGYSIDNVTKATNETTKAENNQSEAIKKETDATQKKTNSKEVSANLRTELEKINSKEKGISRNELIKKFFGLEGAKDSYSIKADARGYATVISKTGKDYKDNPTNFDSLLNKLLSGKSPISDKRELENQIYSINGSKDSVSQFKELFGSHPELFESWAFHNENGKWKAYSKDGKNYKDNKDAYDSETKAFRDSWNQTIDDIINGLKAPENQLDSAYKNKIVELLGKEGITQAQKDKLISSAINNGYVISKNKSGQEFFKNPMFGDVTDDDLADKRNKISREEANALREQGKQIIENRNATKVQKTEEEKLKEAENERIREMAQKIAHINTNEYKNGETARLGAMKTFISKNKYPEWNTKYAISDDNGRYRFISKEGQKYLGDSAKYDATTKKYLDFWNGASSELPKSESKAQDNGRKYFKYKSEEVAKLANTGDKDAIAEMANRDTYALNEETKQWEKLKGSVKKAGEEVQKTSTNSRKYQSSTTEAVIGFANNGDADAIEELSHRKKVALNEETGLWEKVKVKAKEANEEIKQSSTQSTQEVINNVEKQNAVANQTSLAKNIAETAAPTQEKRDNSLWEEISAEVEATKINIDLEKASVEELIAEYERLRALEAEHPNADISYMQVMRTLNDKGYYQTNKGWLQGNIVNGEFVESNQSEVSPNESKTTNITGEELIYIMRQRYSQSISGKSILENSYEKTLDKSDIVQFLSAFSPDKQILKDGLGSSGENLIYNLPSVISSESFSKTILLLKNRSVDLGNILIDYYNGVVTYKEAMDKSMELVNTRNEIAQLKLLSDKKKNEQPISSSTELLNSNNASNPNDIRKQIESYVLGSELDSKVISERFGINHDDVTKAILGNVFSDSKQPLIDALVELATRAGSKFGETLKDSADSSLGIHSPSTVFQEIGYWCGEGFIVGFDKEGKKIEGNTEEFKQRLLNALSLKGVAINDLSSFYNSDAFKGARNTAIGRATKQIINEGIPQVSNSFAPYGADVALGKDRYSRSEILKSLGISMVDDPSYGNGGISYILVKLSDEIFEEVKNRFLKDYSSNPSGTANSIRNFLEEKNKENLSKYGLDEKSYKEQLGNLYNSINLEGTGFLYARERDKNGNIIRKPNGSWQFYDTVDSSGWYTANWDENSKFNFKTYGEFINPKSINENVLTQIMKALTSAGFKGQLKVPGTATDDSIYTDQLVVHGANIDMQKIAYEVLTQQFGHLFKGVTAGFDLKSIYKTAMGRRVLDDNGDYVKEQDGASFSQIMASKKFDEISNIAKSEFDSRFSPISSESEMSAQLKNLPSIDDIVSKTDKELMTINDAYSEVFLAIQSKKFDINPEDKLDVITRFMSVWQEMLSRPTFEEDEGGAPVYVGNKTAPRRQASNLSLSNLDLSVLKSQLESAGSDIVALDEVIEEMIMEHSLGNVKGAFFPNDFKPNELLYIASRLRKEGYGLKPDKASEYDYLDGQQVVIGKESGFAVRKPSTKGVLKMSDFLNPDSQYYVGSELNLLPEEGIKQQVAEDVDNQNAALKEQSQLRKEETKATEEQIQATKENTDAKTESTGLTKGASINYIKNQLKEKGIEVTNNKAGDIFNSGNFSPTNGKVFSVLTSALDDLILKYAESLAQEAESETSTKAEKRFPITSSYDGDTSDTIYRSQVGDANGDESKAVIQEGIAATRTNLYHGGEVAYSVLKVNFAKLQQEIFKADKEIIALNSEITRLESQGINTDSLRHVLSLTGDKLSQLENEATKYLSDPKYFPNDKNRQYALGQFSIGRDINRQYWEGKINQKELTAEQKQAKQSLFEQFRYDYKDFDILSNQMFSAAKQGNVEEFLRLSTIVQDMHTYLNDSAISFNSMFGDSRLVNQLGNNWEISVNKKIEDAILNIDKLKVKFDSIRDKAWNNGNWTDIQEDMYNSFVLGYNNLRFGSYADTQSWDSIISWFNQYSELVSSGNNTKINIDQIGSKFGNLGFGIEKLLNLSNSDELVGTFREDINVIIQEYERLKTVQRNLSSGNADQNVLQAQAVAVSELSDRIKLLTKNYEDYLAINPKTGTLEMPGRVNASNFSSMANKFLSDKGYSTFSIDSMANGKISGVGRLNGAMKEFSLTLNKTANGMNYMANNTQKTMSNFSLLGSSLKKTFGMFSYYFSAYRIGMTIISKFKEGFNTLKSYDAALTTISYTMDVTKSQLNELGKSAIQMSNDLSISLENSLKIYQIYANMNTTAKDIAETGRATAVLSNLSGVDASSAADQVQGIIQQFNLLEESGENTADTCMHIVDVLNTISANVSLDYAKGISVITEAVTATGQVAHDAGMSYEELAAISAKVAERTREDGSTIGNAMKTMFTRISKVASMPSYADDIDNETVSKAASALHEVGIEVYNANGEFRDITDTITALNDKWGTLTDAQKSYISYQIAATRQSSKFKSMLEAWSDAMKLADEAANNSDGSAMENQEKYVESYAGKLQSITNNMQEFFLNLLSSDGFKKILDIITGITDGLVKMGKTIGPVKSLVSLLGGLVGLNSLGLIGKNLSSIVKNLTLVGKGEGLFGGFREVNMFSQAIDNANRKTKNLNATFATTAKGFLKSSGILAIIASIIAAITVIISSINKAKAKIEESIENYKTSSNELKDQIELLKEQEKIISDSNSSIDDVNSARKEALNIENEILSKYEDDFEALKKIKEVMADINHTSEDLSKTVQEIDYNSMMNSMNLSPENTVDGTSVWIKQAWQGLTKSFIPYIGQVLFSSNNQLAKYYKTTNNKFANPEDFVETMKLLEMTDANTELSYSSAKLAKELEQFGGRLVNYNDNVSGFSLKGTTYDRLNSVNNMIEYLEETNQTEDKIYSELKKTRTGLENSINSNESFYKAFLLNEYLYKDSESLKIYDNLNEMYEKISSSSGSDKEKAQSDFLSYFSSIMNDSSISDEVKDYFKYEYSEYVKQIEQLKLGELIESGSKILVDYAGGPYHTSINSTDDIDNYTTDELLRKRLVDDTLKKALESLRIDYGFNTVEELLDFLHEKGYLLSDADIVMLDKLGSGNIQYLKDKYGENSNEYKKVISKLTSTNLNDARDLIKKNIDSYDLDPSKYYDTKEYMNDLKKIDELTDLYYANDVEILTRLIEMGDEFLESLENNDYKYSTEVSSVQKTQSGFDIMDKIYSDIIDYGTGDGSGNTFDYSSLTSDDFKDTFGNLDAYESFIKTIVNNTAGMTTVSQEQFDLLATQLIFTSEAFDNLDSSSLNFTTNFLTQMGVTNAAEVATMALNAQLDYETLALEKTSQGIEMYSSDLNKATLNDMLNLRNEEGAFDETTMAIVNYWAAKNATEFDGIITSSSCEQLIALAEAANITSGAIAQLKSLQNQIDTWQINYDNATVGTSFYDVAASTLEGLKTQQAELSSQLQSDIVDYYSKYSVAKYGGGTTSNNTKKSSSDDAKKKLDEAITYLEKQYDAEQITFSNYLNARLGLIQDYYDKGLIKASDYYAELEEYYKAQLDGYDTAINAIDDLIDEEIKRINDEKQALSDANDERQKAIDLQKAEYNLAKSINQRTRLVKLCQSA